MGGGFSRLALPSCFKTASEDHHPDLIFTSSEHLDETLGHSFCYVPSSSPSHSSRRFLSPSHSLRLPSETALKTRYPAPETAFRSISGASIGANTSNPRTILQPDVIYRNAADPLARLNSGGFESSSSFYALPLQPVPRICGASDASSPLDRGFFMSGPIERGALSGPLDAGGAGDIHFSAPLGGVYMNKRRRKGFPSSSVRKALLRSFSEKKRPWVVPVLNFVGRKDSSTAAGAGAAAAGAGDGSDLEVNGEKVQWAHGKAGEDRVHVVVSEDHGWLFVGIYDGFNGTDAPEFLMGHLYRAVFKELEGLFWETVEEDSSLVLAQEEVKEEILDDVVTADQPNPSREIADSEKDCCSKVRDKEGQSLECGGDLAPSSLNCGGVKRVTFELEQKMGGSKRGKTLWEYLKEVDDDDEGLDLSGSDRFSFSVANVFRVKTVSSAVGRRPVLFPKLKFGTNREKESQRKLFSCGHDWEDKEKIEVDRIGDKLGRSLRRCKVGPADHASVLSALSRALDITEMAYLEMTDMVLDKNPELALTGSCLLVVLMKDEDVYVMNVGDSRAIVAQYQPHPIGSGSEPQGQAKGGLESEGIVEESDRLGDAVKPVAVEETDEIMKLTALQLSTDHSTSIEEEVLRIKAEHPDDCHCIVNDRVKGRLKVTRAFGAGFLKKPKWNNAMLEMFRNEYIGTDPYITCCPSLCHHKLCSNDHFLVLSSDGLYQYLTNQEVVSYVENFMEKFPDGDPAQNLIEELLSRAAKKAGMDFHELLDIPQGDRRKYHDDVTVMVISLEGRIWKSSGKYV